VGARQWGEDLALDQPDLTLEVDLLGKEPPAPKGQPAFSLSCESLKERQIG
jgi:hypothetical protein